MRSGRQFGGLMLAWLVCSSLAGWSVQARADRSLGDAVPVVVELFTSEGCSSCPPADALLGKLIDTQPAAGVRIIGLGEHVDYWDHQGWRDRFSSASLTQRQQLYGARFNDASIYTPQMVVDGRSEFVGSDGEAARRAIEKAAALPHARVEIRFEAPLRATIVASAVEVARGERADFVLAITEDRLQSDVTRGENHGRVLKHAAVVRSLQTLGEPFAGATATATTDLRLGDGWRREHLQIVAFVQERRSRAILGAAAVPMPPR
jgi:hypothetical protein